MCVALTVSAAVAVAAPGNGQFPSAHAHEPCCLPHSTPPVQAICILRPTQETLRTLSAHLKAPKFAKYYLNFTNVVNGDALRRLAQEDEVGVIAQVQEHYADYYAINPDFFHLGVRHSLSMCRPRALHTHHDDLSTAQTQQGLLAMLLSFRVKPQIRYLASSEVAGRVALGLANAIAGERELFSSSKITGHTLLVRCNAVRVRPLKM